MSLVAEQSVSNEEITGWKVALKEIQAALNKQESFVTFQKEGLSSSSLSWRWFPRRALVLIKCSNVSYHAVNQKALKYSMTFSLSLRETFVGNS